MTVYVLPNTCAIGSVSLPFGPGVLGPCHTTGTYTGRFGGKYVHKMRMPHRALE